MSFRWESDKKSSNIYILKNDNVIGGVKKSSDRPGMYYYIDYHNYNSILTYFDTIEECKCALMIRLGICIYKELSREDGLVTYEF